MQATAEAASGGRALNFNRPQEPPHGAGCGGDGGGGEEVTGCDGGAPTWSRGGGGESEEEEEKEEDDCELDSGTSTGPFGDKT